MSKRALRIPLAELKTVRVKCKECGVVFEVATADLKGLFSNGHASVEVEFVVPAPD